MEVPQMHYGQLERPLLLTDKKITRPDARLALFALQQNVRNPAWQPGQGFMIQGALLATSPNAEVLPFFSVDSGFAVPATIRYSLSVMKDQAALRILQNKIVVIGQENDADADDLLLNVLSLEHANFVLPAAAFSWIHLGVTTIVFVFLLLMPFVAFRVSALLSALLLVSFILGQQIFFSVHREWLPVSQWILFLVTGYVWMALWCIKQSSIAAPSIAQPVIPPRSGTKESKKRFSLNVFKKNGNPIRTRIQPTMEGMRAAEATFDSDSSLSFTTAERSTVGISAATNAGGMPQHLGRYQIVRELGRGAMGVVYLAFDPKISRQIAIKTLHYNQFDAAELPTIKERFFSEARAAGNLKHEHIVTIHDAGEEQDLAYVAMDYVDGVALSAHTHKGDLLDVELVYYIMAMAADAVYSAHSKGIIHRDIKPSNILYDPKTNEVKVADFGIARIMNASVTRTRTGDLLGSPLYMSPEQIRGEKVTTQTDIFSLGVTFYQLLTGELPFKADNIANLTYQIVQCKYTPVDEIRPELPISAKRIITKALQKNPANRYASAAEMQRALQDAYSKDFS
jgi:serine/threonine-protein kinase